MTRLVGAKCLMPMCRKRERDIFHGLYTFHPPLMALFNVTWRDWRHRRGEKAVPSFSSISLSLFFFFNSSHNISPALPIRDVSLACIPPFPCYIVYDNCFSPFQTYLLCNDQKKLFFLSESMLNLARYVINIYKNRSAEFRSQ